MGAGNSVEIPGGGSEGYHVLRVSIGSHLLFAITNFARIGDYPKFKK